MAMASLLSLDQAQMVGLMMVWVCVVVGRCLFFGSGKVDCAVCVVVVRWLFFGSSCELCRLWCFFGSSMYYFIGMDILFYCSRYIILL